MLDYRSFRKNITSQNGEDGIIEAILNRLRIKNGWCVEFGAWDGKHLSNTWNLWHNLGWSAVLIEGDPSRARELAESVDNLAKVFSICSYVSCQGKNKLDNILKATEIPRDFEILSIDIDGDDWYIWNSLADYHPKIVICEFSMWFPPNTPFLNMPGSDNLGCSAYSLLELGLSKGYELVCCNNVNAIFIRSDLVRELGLSGTSEERLFSTQDCYDLSYMVPSVFQQISSAWTNAGSFDRVEQLATAWLIRLKEIRADNESVVAACKAVIIECPLLQIAYDLLFLTIQSDACHVRLGKISKAINHRTVRPSSPI